MMDKILLQLLESLRKIGEHHPELYDSEVREQMGGAIMEAFVRRRSDYQMPDDFGMHSESANRQVKSTITTYVERANDMASKSGLTRFHDRLAAFQNPEVHTSVPGNDYEEIFGHTPPEFYDENGIVIRNN